MKKILFTLVIVASTIMVQAQKIYSTKTAIVSFFSHTPTEDIEAFNNQVLSKLTDKGLMNFSLLIKGFRFENELMQEHFNGKDYMESDKFPKAEFKGAITNIATVRFDKNGNFPVVVAGNLTIKGITKKVSAKGTISVTNGKVLAKSVFNIKIKEFGLTGKDIGTIIANDMKITVTSKYD
ncbi:MAG: YceI family protein [Chitinophagaceae bacterium]